MSDRDHYALAAGIAGALPIIVKAALFLFAVAALIAMALGKVSVLIGGGGLVGVIVFAVVSSIVKGRRLKKAMAESDLP
jgi:hypothetical protein